MAERQSTEKGHVLIIEDDPSLAKMTEALLADRGYHTTVLDDPRIVGSFIKDHSIDLVLLDAVLPYIDGYTLCGAIRREHPDIPVIFVSARCLLEDKLAGYNKGADDYITKPFDPNVLLIRMEAVLRRYRRGERDAPSVIVNVGETSLDIGRLQFRASSCRAISLTYTETKILECLMRNPNVTIPRERLIDWTSGHNSAGTSNRIDVYVRRLRKKIEKNPDEPDFIHTVRGKGYIFRGGHHDATPPSLCGRNRRLGNDGASPIYPCAAQ